MIEYDKDTEAMRNTKTKWERALATAHEAAKVLGISLDERPMVDYNFPNTLPKCVVVSNTPKGAVVVYEDEPSTLVSAAYGEHRFKEFGL